MEPAREREGAPPRGVWQRLREGGRHMAAQVSLWRCTYVGAGTRTLGRPRIVNLGLIEIHSGALIDSRFSPVELVAAPGGRIVVGERAVIGHGTILAAKRLVELGDMVTLGAYCIVTDEAISQTGTPSDGGAPIWIGDEVVIGARVTVLRGATIGARCHILPGSIVAGEILPGVVAGGRPARALRWLPDATRAVAVWRAAGGPP